MFSVAPRLSELLITDVLWDGYSPQLSIPWTQIRRYRGVFKSSQQLNILRQSANLVECSIGFDDVTTTHGNIMVVLPLLRRLCVEGSNILDHFTAPALEDLVVPTVAPSLVYFVQRSSCHLRTFVINQGSSAAGLVDLLEACPSLTHLVLSFGGLPSPELGDITPLFTALHATDSVASTVEFRSIRMSRVTADFWK
ncbi:hypothetical protein FB45DRAFT_1041445 [Roridomyces roridus]|uniref:Uncharacterized protein n=1 Tax=Roridomyces roridus TaxID=1738132 RepID=A0AAD7B014_9AGAR|nr:hypothetical protein FB45DRAFT_1041445 [Roridomyces roridus]